MNIHGAHSYSKQGALGAAGVRRVWTGAGPQHAAYRGGGILCGLAHSLLINWSTVPLSSRRQKHQMAPICSKRRGLEANGTTQTRCNSQITSPDPFRAHFARMDDNAYAKRILSTLPPEDWRRPRGRLRITWLSTVQQDLRFTISHCLKQWIWPRTGLCGGCGRHGATQSQVACQKRWRRYLQTLEIDVVLRYYNGDDQNTKWLKWVCSS